MVTAAAIALALEDTTCWSVGGVDVPESVAIDDCAKPPRVLLVEAASSAASEDWTIFDAVPADVKACRVVGVAGTEVAVFEACVVDWDCAAVSTLIEEAEVAGASLGDERGEEDGSALLESEDVAVEAELPDSEVFEFRNDASEAGDNVAPALTEADPDVAAPRLTSDGRALCTCA